MESEKKHPWSILERGTGSWSGVETMMTSPGESMNATSRVEAHLILNGRGLASDYTQEVGGRVTLHAHTVIRWDEKAEAFVMYFHAQPGGPPMESRGRSEGDRLIFEGPGPHGPMRQTTVYGDGTMTVQAEVPDGNGGWMEIFGSEYTKVNPLAEALPGQIVWTDLTVPDADEVQAFYAQVVGWSSEAVPVDDYHDYNLTDAEGTPTVGVCHARGKNAALPASWLIYVSVADLADALAKVAELGGEIVVPIREMGWWRMAVIRDPSGAALALFDTPD